MSKKMEALMKRASDNQKKAEQLRAEIEQAKAQALKYEEEAEQAAGSGDVTSYKALKQKATDANAIVYVKQANVKKLTSPCTEEEARAAWEEFRREHDTVFTKALKEYDEEVKKQKARFMSIMKLQWIARDQRKALAKLANFSDTAAIEAFKFAYVDGFSMGADRTYFLNKHEITPEDSSMIVTYFLSMSQL